MKESQSPTVGQRNFTIDTLRTIATILVVLLHVSSTYVRSGMSTSTYDLSFWVGNVVDSFSRICVPVFVLISGMYLLGKEETIQVFYKKRASKILLPLIFWSILYIMYGALVNYVRTNDFNFIGLMKNTAAGTPFYHMWYNQFIRTQSRRSIWIAAFFFLALGMIYDYYLGQIVFFIFWFISYLGYFILGYLLKGFISKISNTWLILTYIICGILISIATYYTVRYFNSLYFYNYLSPFVIISSLSIFLLFQQINFKENRLSKISHLTLGIYLIHAGILNVLVYGRRLLNSEFLNNPLLGIPLEFTITFTISLFITSLFYKNGFLKRTI